MNDVVADINPPKAKVPLVIPQPQIPLEKLPKVTAAPNVDNQVKAIAQPVKEIEKAIEKPAVAPKPAKTKPKATIPEEARLITPEELEGLREAAKRDLDFRIRVNKNKNGTFNVQPTKKDGYQWNAEQAQKVADFLEKVGIPLKDFEPNNPAWQEGMNYLKVVSKPDLPIATQPVGNLAPPIPNRFRAQANALERAAQSTKEKLNSLNAEKDIILNRLSDRVEEANPLYKEIEGKYNRQLGIIKKQVAQQERRSRAFALDAERLDNLPDTPQNKAIRDALGSLTNAQSELDRVKSLEQDIKLNRELIASVEAQRCISLMSGLSLDSVRVINPILTNVAHGFRQPEFVGNLMFPPVEVPTRKGKILRFNDDELFLHNMRRAPGGDIVTTIGGWGSDDYELYQDAIAERLPIEYIEEAAATVNLNLQTRSVNKAMRRVALRLEYDQLNLAGTAAQYASTNTLALSGSSQWSDGTSNPEQQFDDAHKAVQDGCGLMANTAVFSLKAFNALKRHPLVRDKFKYTSAMSITLDMILSAFNLRKGAIAAAKYKVINGIAKLDMFDNRAWIGYVPGNGDMGTVMPAVESSIDQPSFGYTYTLKGYPIVEQPEYRKSNSTWFFPVKAERAPVLTGMGAGYLWTNVSS